MTGGRGGPRDPERRLEPHEVETLRGVLGQPRVPRLKRALDEVERQVAMDDIAILLVEGLSGAARVFFDVLAHIGADRDAPSPRRRKEGDRP
jgi:hypothetical protein